MNGMIRRNAIYESRVTLVTRWGHVLPIASFSLNTIDRERVGRCRFAGEGRRGAHRPRERRRGPPRREGVQPAHRVQVQGAPRLLAVKREAHRGAGEREPRTNRRLHIYI
eukprot:1182568-Prorocentrum_minimum.AAC.1